MALVLFAATPGQAQGCKPLTLLTRVHFQRDRSGRRILVRVKIDGKSRLMMLDTGDWFSMLSPAAVRALNLPSRATDWREYGITGHYGQYGVRAQRFAIGHLHWHRVDFFEMHRSKNVGGQFGSKKRPIGLIGANILKNFDIDIDYGSDTLSILSPDHCPGHVIYWKANAIAAVPMSLNDSWQIALPVRLDGYSLNAIIDTGSANSTLNLSTAESDFDVHPGSPNTPKVGYVQETDGDTYFTHRFHSIAFSGIEVRDPKLLLMYYEMEKDLDSGPALGSLFSHQNRRDRAPLLIGGDILQHFHIYIAYHEHMLYITPAGTPKH